MKIISNFFLCFVLLLCAQQVSAQRLRVIKTLYIGGDAIGVQINNAVNTDDKGLLFVGFVDTGAHGQIPATRHAGYELLIGKIDSQQNLQWVKTYGSSGNDAGVSVILSHAANGGYVVLAGAGANDGDAPAGHGGGDYWLLKLDRNGNIDWSRCYGSPQVDYPYQVIETADKGYLMIGATNATTVAGDVPSRYELSDFSGDWFAVKVDSAGNKQWARVYGGTGDEEPASAIIQGIDGYYIAGTSNSRDHECTNVSWHNATTITDPLVWLIRIDTLGNVKWNRSFGSSKGATFGSALWDRHDSTIVICSSTNGTDFMAAGNHMAGTYAPSDMLIIKTDTGGHIRWNRMIGTSWDEDAYSITAGEQNGYLVYGQTMASGNPAPPAPVGVTGNAALLISVLDSGGNELYYKAFGGMTSSEYPKTILPYKNGYAATGATFAPPFTEGVNVSRFPNAAVLGFISYLDYWKVNVPPVKKSITRLVVSPNPATAKVDISCGAVDKGRLTVVDESGKTVYTSNVTGPGYKATIDTSSWAAGVYFATLTSEQYNADPIRFLIR